MKRLQPICFVLFAFLSGLMVWTVLRTGDAVLAFRTQTEGVPTKYLLKATVFAAQWGFIVPAICAVLGLAGAFISLARPRLTGSLWVLLTVTVCLQILWLILVSVWYDLPCHRFYIFL